MVIDVSVHGQNRRFMSALSCMLLLYDCKLRGQPMSDSHFPRYPGSHLMKEKRYKTACGLGWRRPVHFFLHSPVYLWECMIRFRNKLIIMWTVKRGDCYWPSCALRDSLILILACKYPPYEPVSHLVSPWKSRVYKEIAYCPQPD